MNNNFKMFDPKFNPEFNWQIAHKQRIRKHLFFIILSFVLFLSIFFIFKKYYFISGRNVNLNQIIPKQTKVILEISPNELIKKVKKSVFKQDSFLTNLGLNNLLDNEKFKLFSESLGKKIYFLENSPKSQTVLLKISNIDLNQEALNPIIANAQSIKFNNKLIYEFNVDSIDSLVIPIPENKLYFSYLNNYILCLSNDLDYVKQIVNNYKEVLRINYLGSLKQELASYFQEQRILMLKVDHYPASEMNQSLSWIKNLSFLSKESSDNSFVLKFKAGFKSLELLFTDSNDSEQRIGADALNKKINDDLLFYFNENKDYQNNNLNLNDSVSNFLKNNIGSLYNFDFKEKLTNLKTPYHILIYPNNNFLLFSKNYKDLESIYKKILAPLNPQTRMMILPDGTQVEEYYSDPKSIDLQEKQIHDITWYYYDSLESVNFYLLRYHDWYIFTNFKEKILDFSQTQTDLCELLYCDQNHDFYEILSLNLKNISSKNYLPWLNLFLDSYSSLNVVNLNQKGQKPQNKLFFELIR